MMNTMLDAVIDPFLFCPPGKNKDGLYPSLTPSESSNGFGTTMINGVEVPQLVKEQLEQRGHGNAASYSRGELEAAILGAAVDCRVFDDPHGDDFHDQLVKTHAEAEEEKAHHMHSEPTDLFGERPPASFVEREKKRRLQRDAEPNYFLAC